MQPPAKRRNSKAPAAAVGAVLVLAVVAGFALTRGAGVKTSTSSVSESLVPTASTTSLSSSTLASASTSTSASASSQASSSSSTHSTSSTTVENATFISDLNADVSGFAIKNLSYNDSFYQGNDFYAGQAGFAFDAEIQVTYNQCSGQCPTEVTNVTTLEPGFVVQASLPVQGTVLGTSVEEFDFVVTVTPPMANYNGPLVFYCTMAQ